MMKGNPRINGYVSTSNEPRSKLNTSLFNVIKNNVTTASNQTALVTSINGTCAKSKVSVGSHFSQNAIKDPLHVANINPETITHINNMTGSCNVRPTNKRVARQPQPQLPSHVRKRKLRATHHEMLQRIESQLDSFNHYQHHWFSSGLERLKLEPLSREERLEITRYELNRHLAQMLRSEVGSECALVKASSVCSPSVTSSPHLHFSSTFTATDDDTANERTNAALLPPPPKTRPSAGFVISDTCAAASSLCCVCGCSRAALPCARLCAAHITRNPDQVLFSSCTAKFADNTQCAVPVFDIMHELPLCVEHARKRDNYKLNQETKPKKLRKKVKPSAMIRPQKRNKKKKKRSSPRISPDKTMVTSSLLKQPTFNPVETAHLSETEEFDNVLSLQPPQGSSPTSSSPSLSPTTIIHLPSNTTNQHTHMIPPPPSSCCSSSSPSTNHNEQPLLVPSHQHEEVIESEAPFPQEVLEETDINTVLSTIHADEFNDLFSAVNRNGEYEPTREETEELERALAAVDNDVKSLEKLSQSHGLLDTFLDEHSTLVESLVQHMGGGGGGGAGGEVVFHQNGGYVATASGGGSGSRLLSVQQNQ